MGCACVLCSRGGVLEEGCRPACGGGGCHLQAGVQGSRRRVEYAEVFVTAFVYVSSKEVLKIHLALLVWKCDGGFIGIDCELCEVG